jgi:exodeoxyribonuclease VII large subunit
VPHSSQPHRDEWVPATKPPAPKPLSEPTVYTVRQLIAELRQHIEGTYTGILNVEGEISNCRPAASGHVYFTLKDGDAQLPVVLFRRQAQLLGFKPRDGMFVEARGRISLYETRGQLQLIAETLGPRGEGALQLAFEQLKRRLKAEGLFDRPRKPLPAFPHCIGIVTSPSGAAIRDIINVVRRRHARLNLLIYPAVVQGAQCPASVIAGIKFFNQPQNRLPHVSPVRRRKEAEPIPQVDLIILARGGGSLEDLAGFNDEALARAIASSSLPIVSAIGHEIDHTIADFVSDLRAPTPSAAAELVTAAQHRIEERVLTLERRVKRAAEFHILRARQRLQRLSAEQVLARLRDSVSLRQQKIDELRFRIAAAAERRLRNRINRIAALEVRLRRHDPSLRLAVANRRLASANDRLQRLSTELVTRRQGRLTHAAARLEALSPLAVLSRGYAIVYGPDGAILRSAGAVHTGLQIRARLADGSVRATVVGTTLDRNTDRNQEKSAS